MANFDEDIRRITNEVLQDGTVDQIIWEKVTDGIKGAISDSLGYGKLRNAIKERVEQVLVDELQKQVNRLENRVSRMDRAAARARWRRKP